MVKKRESRPAEMAAHLAIGIESVSKTYGKVRAIDKVSLAVEPGEMTALIGPSGSGKSTLLRLINGLTPSDPAPNSSIQALGEPIQRGGEVVGRIRQARSGIGFIFQNYNLIGRLSLHRNILVGCSARLPLWRNLLFLHGEEERRRAMAALQAVGLARFAAQRASTLSGGQQQRGAIARAIMQNAKLILADEPIASLDPQSARRIMEILVDLNRSQGITILVSLHQIDFAIRYCRRIVALNQGRIQFDGAPEELDQSTFESIYGKDPSTGQRLAAIVKNPSHRFS